MKKKGLQWFDVGKPSWLRRMVKKKKKKKTFTNFNWKTYDIISKRGSTEKENWRNKWRGKKTVMSKMATD